MVELSLLGDEEQRGCPYSWLAKKLPISHSCCALSFRLRRFIDSEPTDELAVSQRKMLRYTPSMLAARISSDYPYPRKFSKIVSDN